MSRLPVSHPLRLAGGEGGVIRRSSAVEPEYGNSANGDVATPFQGRGRGIAREVDVPSAIRSLSALQAVEVTDDRTVIEKSSHGTARLGGEVEQVQRLALGSSDDRKRAVRGDEPGKALEDRAGFGVQVAGSVEELETKRSSAGGRRKQAGLIPARTRKSRFMWAWS